MKKFILCALAFTALVNCKRREFNSDTKDIVTKVSYSDNEMYRFQLQNDVLYRYECSKGVPPIVDNCQGNPARKKWEDVKVAMAAVIEDDSNRNYRLQRLKEYSNSVSNYASEIQRLENALTTERASKNAAQIQALEAQKAQYQKNYEETKETKETIEKELAAIESKKANIPEIEAFLKDTTVIYNIAQVKTGTAANVYGVYLSNAFRNAGPFEKLSPSTDPLSFTDNLGYVVELMTLQKPEYNEVYFFKGKVGGSKARWFDWDDGHIGIQNTSKIRAGQTYYCKVISGGLAFSSCYDKISAGQEVFRFYVFNEQGNYAHDKSEALKPFFKHVATHH